jgi:hypothetical protein
LTDDAIALHGLRRMLRAILLLGMTGTGIDLLLLGHFEDLAQLVPLLLVLAGIMAVLWNASGHKRWSIVVVQIVMVLFIAGGALGLYFHYDANVEFQQEIDESLRGTRLLWTALRAKTPPALAPATMMLLGLIGLAHVYRHPAVAPGDSLEENRDDA